MLEPGLIAAFVILSVVIVALVVTLAVLQTRPTGCATCNSSPPTNAVPIYIVNQSTVVSGTTLANYTSGVQAQLNNHVFPSWKVNANLIIVASTSDIPSGNWYLLVQDNTNTPGTLGYHSLDANGIPYGIIFANTIIQAGLVPSTTLSHEILEMLVDPFVDSLVFKQTSNTTGTLIYLEVCDPVESNTYVINGVTVSDFVFPRWFSPSVGGQYDQLNLVSQSYQLLNGGYSLVFEVPNSGAGFVQETGPGVITLNGQMPFTDGTRLLIMKQRNK